MPKRSDDSGPSGPTQAAAPPTNFRPGDWMCPKCNFHNYRSKATCPQCSTPQPAGGSSTPAPASDSPAALAEPAASAEGEPKKAKKSKWDQEGDPASSVPDWLKDLMPKAEPKAPPGVDPARFKVLKVEGVQVRALIGKGGETIMDVRSRSGSEIKIDHLPTELMGTVTIVGDVDKTEAMIKEVLASKGCPLGMPKPGSGPPGAPGAAGAPGMPGMPGVPREIPVPGELVGGLIGPGGSTINDLRQKVGGAVQISVLPATSPGGPQVARITGPEPDLTAAEAMVAGKVEELKSARRPKAPAIMNAMGSGPGMGMIGGPLPPGPRPPGAGGFGGGVVVPPRPGFGVAIRPPPPPPGPPGGGMPGGMPGGSFAKGGPPMFGGPGDGGAGSSFGGCGGGCGDMGGYGGYGGMGGSGGGPGGGYGGGPGGGYGGGKDGGKGGGYGGGGPGGGYGGYGGYGGGCRGPGGGYGGCGGGCNDWGSGYGGAGGGGGGDMGGCGAGGMGGGGMGMAPPPPAPGGFPMGGAGAGGWGGMVE